MLKVERVVCFLITLLFSVVSLAATCSPEDTNCALNQKKIQLMDKMDIKPTATKNQPTEDDNKQPPKPLPFQIPKPESLRAKTDKGQTPQPQLKPWSNTSDQPVQSSQEQESTSQQPKTESQPVTQPQSGIKYL